jgi:hypothetical protein
MNIDKLAGVFMVGFWIGMLTFFMVFLMLCSEKINNRWKNGRHIIHL